MPLAWRHGHEGGPHCNHNNRDDNLYRVQTLHIPCGIVPPGKPDQNTEGFFLSPHLTGEEWSFE